jgi:hypothetical protein
MDIERLNKTLNPSSPVPFKVLNRIEEELLKVYTNQDKNTKESLISSENILKDCWLTETEIFLLSEEVTSYPIQFSLIDFWRTGKRIHDVYIPTLDGDVLCFVSLGFNKGKLEKAYKTNDTAKEFLKYLN